MADHVRIELTGHGQGRVYVDDVEIRGVRRLAFNARTGDANVLELELSAAAVDITGPADVLGYQRRTIDQMIADQGGDQ